MQLLPFEKEDFNTLYRFMKPIWEETYGKILPKEQISLLLDKYFSTDGIEHYISLGYKYFKLYESEAVGVVIICDKNGSTYLDKLYLIPSARGKGYAEYVFGILLKMGKDITLNVNQGNKRAIACYKKNGFIIESEEKIPLGNGLVNVDYNMRLTKENFISKKH